jgi:hypothetical protein
MGHFRYPPNILRAILVRETKVAVKPMADVVSVKDITRPARIDKMALKRKRKRGLAGRTQSG